MSLRIGFDLDGVLADMDAALLHEARALFGEDAVGAMQQRDTDEAPNTSRDANSPDDAPTDDTAPVDRLALTSRQQRRLWHHVETIGDFWQSLHEIEPGAVRRLAQLADERRWGDHLSHEAAANGGRDGSSSVAALA